MNFPRIIPMMVVLATFVAAPALRADNAHVHSAACIHGLGAWDSRSEGVLKATPSVPTVANYALNPNVISASATGSIRLSARLIGPMPTRAELVSQWGVTYALSDAGGVDDALAGDGIYSVNLPATQITSRYVASDVGRVFVGFLDLYTGATRGDRYNVFAQVRTSDMPAVAVKPLAANAQLSRYVLNLSLPALYRTHDETDPAITAIVQAAYVHLADQFDFLNVVYDRQQVANRYHFQTKNSVSGVGSFNINLNAQYGNPSRLLGITVFPLAAAFDGAFLAHAHEIGHQWLAFLKNPELAGGSPHWPPSTMASGVMGYSIVGTGAGGSFSCKLTPEGVGLRATPFNFGPTATFNPLDLYLMGLMPAAEVPDQWVITDANFIANWPTLCDGRLLTSGFKRLTIAEVIAANGPRLPDSTAAQRTFRVGTVVVSDGLLSADAMSFYDFFAQRIEARTRVDTHEGLAKQPGTPFFVATEGRGALIATVDPAVTINTKLTVVEYLNSPLNYYFLTSRDNEKSALDAAPGWARTGATFDMLAYPDATVSGNVRFYFDQIAKVAGTGAIRGSHFYSINPADIALLQSLNPTNAATAKLPVNEGVDSYAYRPIPSAGAALATCASGTLPVYRLFRGNARFPDDPNHRFTTSKTVYDQFVGAGWDGEGVNFCVPAN